MSAASVAAEIAGWKRRDRVLPYELAVGWSWRILAFLYDARLRDHQVSVSMLCNLGGPATTCLRHAVALTRAGYIERRRDPFDRRRALVSLTDRAARLLLRCFDDDPPPTSAPALIGVADRLASIEAQTAELRRLLIPRAALVA